MTGVQTCALPICPVRTMEEKEILDDVFIDVYEAAKRHDKNLNQNIKLYIMDTMDVNAFAVGRKTIAITKGSMEAFTKEENHGLLAHEFGHLSHHHTKALLLTVIGNLFFNVLIYALHKLLNLVNFILNLFSSNVVAFVLQMIIFMLKIVINIFT